MADYYVDFNRGSDSNSGTSSSAPWKNLSKISAGSLSAANLQAGSIVHLADDSEWVIEETLSANKIIVLDNYINGADGNPLVITGYGGHGAKPKIKYQIVPQANWWVWDAAVSAWYITLSTALWKRGGIGVRVGDTYGVSAAYGYPKVANAINTSIGVNGMTADTLRWVVPTVANTLFYLAGAGIDAETDPTTAYGYGNLVIYPCAAMHAWNALGNTIIDGLEFEGGGIYATYSNITHNKPGFEMMNCRGNNLCGIFEGISSNANSDSLIEINIHDNEFSNTTYNGIHMFGYFTGEAYRNSFSHGNHAWSNGFIYMQNRANTGGYAPYVVHDNYAEYAKNGTGACEFDGACYYQEFEDDGTIITRNVAAHSYKAYQLNGGRRATLTSNVAYDCCKFGTFTDADNAGTSDYRVCNNLWVSSETPTSYFHGASEGSGNVAGNAVMAAWNNTSTITDVRIQNNLMVVRGSGWDPFFAIKAYDNSLWSGSGVSGLSIDTNAVIGGQISQIVSASSNSVDKSAIYPGTVTGSGGGVGYKDGLPYGLASVECLNAGTDTQIAGIVDFHGAAFQAVPSIGPFEPSTIARWI